MNAVTVVPGDAESASTYTVPPVPIAAASAPTRGANGSVGGVAVGARVTGADAASCRRSGPRRSTVIV